MSAVPANLERYCGMSSGALNKEGALASSFVWQHGGIGHDSVQL